MDKVITIKKIEEKGENWVVVTDEDGKTSNLFQEKCHYKDKPEVVFEGNTVKLTWNKLTGKDGKERWTVVNVEPSGAKEAVSVDKSAQFATSKMESNEKAESVCASYIKDLRCAGVPVPLALYAAMLVYISKNLKVEMSHNEVEAFLIREDPMFGVKK